MIPWGGHQICFKSKQGIALFIFQKRENLLELCYEFLKFAILRMIKYRSCIKALLEQYYKSTVIVLMYQLYWNSLITVL